MPRWSLWWFFSMERTVNLSWSSNPLKFGINVISSPTRRCPVKIRPPRITSLSVRLKWRRMVMRRGSVLLRSGSRWDVSTSHRVGPLCHRLIGKGASPVIGLGLLGNKLSPVELNLLNSRFLNNSVKWEIPCSAEMGTKTVCSGLYPTLLVYFSTSDMMNSNLSLASVPEKVSNLLIAITILEFTQITN